MNPVDEAAIVNRTLAAVHKVVSDEYADRVIRASRGQLRMSQRERGYNDCLLRFQGVIENTQKLVQSAAEEQQYVRT